MITLSDIEAAAGRLAPFINRTPLLESEALNEQTGGRILVKPECLQKTGSFKFRGATNRISQLTEEQKRAGVVAYSSGNHAQGVALAARLHQVPAVIIMPSDAPHIKIENTKRHGAEIVLYDRAAESREEIAAALAEEKGAVLIPPYDDPHIIAGQGTVGLEIAAQAEVRGLQLDLLSVCISGGGLSAGCTLALAEKMPGARICLAEPEGFDDAARSLAAGHPVENAPGARSICDALLLPTPGELTFPILKEHGASGVAVSDGEALRAMRFAFEELKLVVEPGGAVALAAILSGKIDVRERTAAVILTGGNVDAAMMQRALES